MAQGRYQTRLVYQRPRDCSSLLGLFCGCMRPSTTPGASLWFAATRMNFAALDILLNRNLIADIMPAFYENALYDLFCQTLRTPCDKRKGSFLHLIFKPGSYTGAKETSSIRRPISSRQFHLAVTDQVLPLMTHEDLLE